MSSPWDVIPSTVGISSTTITYDSDAFSNDSLRVGEIDRIIYPEDEASRSQKFIEYDVFVVHAENSTAHTRMYRNCILFNQFGGLADFVTYTLRPSKIVPDKENPGLGKGSKVLIACINGGQNNAVIIGGIRDKEDRTEFKFKTGDSHPDDNPGHFYHFIFNGADLLINDNGEIIVTQKGPTKIDGTLDSDKMAESKTGTNVSFLKNGNFEVHTKDDEQHLKIDHENTKVLVKAGAFEINDASDAMVLGTTYRDKESAMFKDLQQGFLSLFAKLTSVGSTLSTAVSAAPGAPVAACVAAGPVLTQAAADCQKMAQSIAKFEAQANDYLSSKHKLGDG